MDNFEDCKKIIFDIKYNDVEIPESGWSGCRQGDISASLNLTASQSSPCPSYSYGQHPWSDYIRAIV